MYKITEHFGSSSSAGLFFNYRIAFDNNNLLQNKNKSDFPVLF